jgi:hypothetical protein
MVRALSALAAPADAPFVAAFRGAVSLRLTGEAPEAFRAELDGRLRQITPDTARTLVRFDAVRAALDSGTGYKRAVFGERWGEGAGNTAFRWLTRGAASMDITTDVMRLPADEQISPHGHRGVVSAMYLLDGEAWFRTWDTIGDPTVAEVPLRPGLDTRFTPGDVSSSSEGHHNLHWVVGVAPVSYILRFTITDVASAKGIRYGREGARCYLDPTAPADPATGLIPGRRITGDESRTLHRPH